VPVAGVVPLSGGVVGGVVVPSGLTVAGVVPGTVAGVAGVVAGAVLSGVAAGVAAGTVLASLCLLQPASSAHAMALARISLLEVVLRNGAVMMNPFSLDC